MPRYPDLAIFMPLQFVSTKLQVAIKFMSLKVYESNYIIHAIQIGKTSTVESRDYTPPFCMLAVSKSGEGAYTRDSDVFRLTTITDRRMPHGRVISGCLMSKT
jgi:hypothetical protein